MKHKIGNTVYFTNENLIFKGIITHISKKEKKWDDDYYDINVLQSNFLTGVGDTVYNLLEDELFTNIEDLINSLKIDLDNRVIRKSL